MNAVLEGEFRIAVESDIVTARKHVREAATSLGFGLVDVTRIVTAASELSRNIYQYAGGGVMRWRTIGRSDTVGLELVFQDNGPGIEDLAKAMEIGFTTGKGLGLGLPGAKRLMDELEIQSTVGEGTTVQVRKWLKK